ncbi:sensor histidine kinase [Alkalitalea saponilacus]|uniref:Histidine kinase n=1 Tax=Alkalitalea saponilacus TaxID=889453 RepID=A0A1T5BCZ8_9BACT|nr:histidine kinase [Alkalitalea saponilacus]ASB49717.1 hypothetical protein CDL62_11495 [Alkalitalea saponilacus]SKB45164.1 Histidine kinase [Alkalitalea saponilacus]
MLKITKTLILFYLLINAAAKEVIPPEIPWRAIVYAENNSHNTKWDYDISISLYGNYTEQDSILVANAIKITDELTETLKVEMSTHEHGNLRIWFVDSTNAAYLQKSHFIPDSFELYWHFTTTNDKDENGKYRRRYEIFISQGLIADSLKQTALTNQLARALYPKHLPIGAIYQREWDYFESPHSLFMSSYISEKDPTYLELSDFDKEMIRTIYSSDFDTLLPIAKNTYRRYHLPPWLTQHRYTLLFWPLIFLAFIFTGLVILMHKKYFVKIRHSFLRFNTTAALGLFFFGLLFSLYLNLGYRLDLHNDSGIKWLGILVGSLITIIIGLPLINLFRLLEIAIGKINKHKFWQSLLIFSSTSIIPPATIFAIVFFSSPNTPIKDNPELFVIIYTWLGFTLVGIIRALINFFMVKEREIKVANEIQLSKLRELKTKAELNALHSRINPHFLYNSLNSIAGLCKTNPEKTERMALSLSRLFRYSINREQSDWTTLKEEMEMIHIYLDIEKIRFDDRLDFEIILPDDLAAERIPRFLIQPLVENALKHGISKKVEKGFVKVSINKENNRLFIIVADNGPAFPDDLIPGFGIQSIYDKLEIMYPNRFELHFVNVPEKKIIIKLD